VSTYAASATVDLAPDADAQRFVEAVAAHLDRDPLERWVRRSGRRTRVALVGTDERLVGAVVAAAHAAGGMTVALLALDHDEYGAEHLVLDGRGRQVCRVHHVYLAPDGEVGGD
jgi:hypothetical protein